MARFFNPNEPEFDYGYGPTIKGVQSGSTKKKPKEKKDDPDETYRRFNAGKYKSDATQGTFDYPEYD